MQDKMAATARNGDLQSRKQNEENDEKYRTNDHETHEQITIYTQTKRVMQIRKLWYRQGKFM